MPSPVKSAVVPQLSRAQLALELARPWLFLAAYAVASVYHLWLLLPPLALGCFLSAFVALHDAMHAAHGLPRAINTFVITASGLLLLKSGHGLRATHLRHHGRVLATDDPEGGVVHWRLARVVLAGPFHVLGNRKRSLDIAPRTWRAQLGETLLTLVMLAAAIEIWLHWGSPAGLVYWAVAALLSATMALWAAYLPHTVSSKHPLLRAAAWSSRAWTPVLSSLAYHDLHHRYPKVPTAGLAALAARLGPDEAHADVTVHVSRARGEG